jgi:hypothetical protein
MMPWIQQTTIAGVEKEEREGEAEGRYPIKAE